MLMASGPKGKGRPWPVSANTVAREPGGCSAGPSRGARSSVRPGRELREPVVLRRERLEGLSIQVKYAFAL